MAACIFGILFRTFTWILGFSDFTSPIGHSPVQHHGKPWLFLKAWEIKFEWSKFCFAAMTASDGVTVWWIKHWAFQALILLYCQLDGIMGQSITVLLRVCNNHISPFPTALGVWSFMDGGSLLVLCLAFLTCLFKNSMFLLSPDHMFPVASYWKPWSCRCNKILQAHDTTQVECLLLKCVKNQAH